MSVSTSMLDLRGDVARAHDQLRRGADPERVLEELSTRLTNKMVHPLIAMLKEASGKTPRVGEPRAEAL